MYLWCSEEEATNPRYTSATVPDICRQNSRHEGGKVYVNVFPHFTIFCKMDPVSTVQPSIIFHPYLENQTSTLVGLNKKKNQQHFFFQIFDSNI